MLYFKKMVFMLLSGLLLSACSMKEYEKQASVFIVFKTPSFKHADLGFIYENSDEIKIEIYGSGQVLVSFVISQDNICMSLLQCLPKQSFNRNVLSASYPVDILEHIFRGQMVFGGKGLSKIRNGFTQKIVKKGKYDIHYSVLNKQITFHDTINDILIKIKRFN